MAQDMQMLPVLVMQYFFEEFMEEDEDSLWEKITVDVEEFRLMGDPAFRWHFRLPKPLFEILLEELGNHLVDHNRIVRVRRPLSHLLLMVLWILATPESFRGVALRFGVCPSEVHNIYVVIIEALREKADEYVQWPSAEERAVISRNLERPSDFPGIVGIMDGCNVPISAPVEDKASYRDYHHQYSIKMQAVCDDKLLVRDLYVGEPGSLHDARVFRRSPFGRNLMVMPQLLSQGEHIIADSAYMLLDQVLTPFENDGHLTDEQRNFNRRLSTVRCRIEHTFGRIQVLWRRLQYFPTVNLDYALDHMVAVIVLHNFRIIHGEEVPIFEQHPAARVEEEMRVPGNDVRQPVPLQDNVIEDPDVPVDIVQALRRSHLLGEQKRWDICNALPPQEPRRE